MLNQNQIKSEIQLKVESQVKTFLFVSNNNLFQKIKIDDIPFSKQARKYYFRREKFMKWLEDRCKYS